jgi:glycopeptide antibiotics resistance protein
MIPTTILTRLWWVLGFLLVGLAIYLCLIPGQELPSPFEFSDKLDHVAGHCILAVYFSGLVARGSWWKLFAALFLLGTGIEIAQESMRFGRNGDPGDVFANTCGEVLGFGLAWAGLSRWTQWAARLLGPRQAIQ